MDSTQSATAFQPICLHTNLFALPFPPVFGDDDDSESFQEDVDTIASDFDVTSFETKSNRPYIIGKEVQRNGTVKPKSAIRCFDDFTIISHIGDGSYAQVYKARDSDNRLVNENST